jgi:hypothetical protein
MSSVHEPVGEQAEQHQCVRQRTVDVHAVFFPQKEDRDGKEKTEPKPGWNAQIPALVASASCGLHTLSTRHATCHVHGVPSAAFPLIFLGRLIEPGRNFSHRRQEFSALCIRIKDF